MKNSIKHKMANKYFSLKFKDGAITGFKNTFDTIDTEYILHDHRFGDVKVYWRELDTSEWFRLSTDKNVPSEDDIKISNGSYQYNCTCTPVAFKFKYELKEDSLFYTMTLKNASNTPIEIGDLALPFPMNKDYKWDKDADLSVFRHSMISQQNSHIYWLRASSTGPFLAMFPQDGAGFEYFRQKHTKAQEQSIFKAYIHAKHDNDIAIEKGCKWRQPITSLILEPGECKSYKFKFKWVKSHDDMHKAIYDEGLLKIKVVPGMTVPVGDDIHLKLSCRDGIFNVTAEHESDTKIELINSDGKNYIYKVIFNKLGENLLNITFGQDKKTIIEFFICEDIETLIKKRATFILKCQHRDKSKWYNGLISEWNMDNKTLLGPDNYDKIKGWRVYEVTCDDPGLCKPAFLAAKNAEYPVQEEVEAMDYYIDNFVWGGLQKTDEEEYSYGIFGIPDWHVLRNSEDPGARGKRHIWRIYDYPHIGLMYYNMYKIARDYPHIETKHDKLVYIERAYRTFLAMFKIPEEIDEWSAYKTGLYNELVMVEVFQELYKLGQKEKALRLESQWARKARSFVNGSQELFNSEYPFDSTGFESTHALAKYALSKTTTKEKIERDDIGFLQDNAVKFMEKQLKGNLFCRGILEKAYYLYGSDYRGSSSAAYTLSYMAQMGGWAIMDYALNYADQANDLLPLGYASYLSSWALMNTGTAESDYGYWYPGIENDGSAGGGFEPSPYGHTWLEQPHHRGSWYYSCEIDLGFLGALRTSRCVFSDDPDFGTICYGGTFKIDEEMYCITPNDGLNKRFSAVLEDCKLSLDLAGARFNVDSHIRISKDCSAIEAEVFTEYKEGNMVSLDINFFDDNEYDIYLDGSKISSFKSKYNFDLPLDKQLSKIHITKR